MKILLSAYACEPNKGSEPGVGWSWANELAKYHDVWVITKDNNEQTISKYLEVHPESKNPRIHFIYVGLSSKLTFWKKGRRGIRLFYMLWQYKAARVADKWNKTIHFDLIQHVTFVSYTQPTYMYKLNIPMIWGPVSGGENIPDSIHIKMSVKEKAIEKIRKISQTIALIDPSIRKTMKCAKYILVATNETRQRIPAKYLDKTIVVPAIGLEKIPHIKEKKKNDSNIRIIMAGRLIYWKAFDIGLRAFLSIANKFPEAKLYILGEGEKKELLKEIAGEYINKQVFFVDPIEHDKIFDYYSQFDIFLNTTLRDSGCMTMMEAMSVGIPCIGIASGGPQELLKDCKETLIYPQGYDECIQAISRRLEDLIEDTKMRYELGKLQREIAENSFVMNKKINTIKNLYF